MIAHFHRTDPMLELLSVDCPVPREVNCGTFDEPEELALHLMEAHERWEIAQLAGKLSIELNALAEFSHEDVIKTAEDLSESWYPIARTAPSGFDPEGRMRNGLVKLVGDETSGQ